jgi:uncharacterized protein (TIGR03437 family)
MRKSLLVSLALAVVPLTAAPSTPLPAITLPLAFEQNAGQTDPQVKYLTRGQGGTLWLTEEGPVLGIAEKARLAVVRMRFDGGRRSPKIEGVNATSGISNYFIGNDPAKWRTDVPQFEKVRYRDVYPGIDVIFYGKDRKLEYDFVLKPGADPSRIRMRFEGAGAIAKDPNGDLVLKVGDVEIRNHKPVVRQGDRIIQGEYKLIGKRAARFVMGAYDRGSELVIDPVMTYGTLLGGNNGDKANSVAIDAQGNLLVVGNTTSANFPLKNPYDSILDSTSWPGTPHVFLTKINPSASGAASMVFSTFFGGTVEELGSALGVDQSGNPVILGSTGSSDLPLMNPFNSKYPDDVTSCTGDDGAEMCPEGFVAKFTASGNALIYSSYLGSGGDYSYSNALAMDASGNAWVAGYTTDEFFPVRGNAFQTSAPITASGSYAGFVGEISPSGSLLYGTYFTGELQTQIQSIAIDSAGNFCIGGITYAQKLPVTAGAFQTKNQSNPSYGTGFVAKINPNVGGTQGLLYSTYLGGSYADGVNAVGVDATGNVYAGGYVYSTNFPVTASAARSTGADIYGYFAGEGFISKLNPAATGTAQLVYSTLYGGSGDDNVNAIAVDSAGRVVFAGVTNSPDLLTTPDAFQCCYAGYATSSGVSQYGFLGRIDPTKSGTASLIYSSLLGGTVFTQINALALDSGGNNVVLGGWIEPPNTPLTLSAFQTAFAGENSNANPGGVNVAGNYLGDAYLASFNFATTGALMNQYENGGGLSAIKSPTIAPGLVFTIKGTFPGPASPSQAQIDPKTGGIATNLEGVQVLVNGIACPLVYVSTAQINAIAPYELGGVSGFANVQVVYNGVPGNILSIVIAPTAPGILSFDDGTGQGAILNQDGSINGAQNAAARGTIITIFATGEGQTNPPGIDGGLATNLNNLPHPVAPVSVTIGNVPATNIAYAGTAPNEVWGLFQLDVTVPAGVTPGPSVPVVLTVGGVASQAGLTMAVQ